MTRSQRGIINWDHGWSFIQEQIGTLIRILDGEQGLQFSVADNMNFYSHIYNMCSQEPPHDYSMQLYNKYREAFEGYINSTVLPSLREKHDEFLLRELVERWSNHKIMVRCLSRAFQFLDCYFTKLNSLPGIKEVGFTCFRDLVYEELKGRVTYAIIVLIDREREGQQINRALPKNVLDIFLEIGRHYEKELEDAMLKDSAVYYSQKSLNWIMEDSCPDYLLKVEECLRKEKDRGAYYLHSSSQPKLLEIVQHQLLVVHSSQLLEKEHSGCRALLRGDKVEDLSRMYRLFSKVSKGLDPVANMFKQHVSAEGIALVQQAEDEASNRADNVDGGLQEQAFVRKVIELHDKCMVYMKDCFSNNRLFKKAMTKAFKVFCNKVVAGSSSEELLASFCDNVLKKGGSEKLNSEAIEETLNKVVNLLTYFSDRDRFAEFYRTKLSLRLLFEKSENDEHERFILTELKNEFGGFLTSKMERMLKDMTLVKENQTNFQKYLSCTPDANLGIELTVSVLSTGVWPIYKSSDLNLPSEMVKCLELFKGFYQTKTNGRKLTWIYSLGTVKINGNFDSKPIELIVGTYQAAVLLLFNATNKLSYFEIKTELNLTDDDLVRVLRSLSCAKYKILLKDPSSGTVSTTDSFEFNAQFTHKRRRRIEILLPPVEERKKVVEHVELNRSNEIDSSIVRIMKSRKVLDNQELVTLCVGQLRHMFKPDFKAIKKRIESLIDREYLERDRENPNQFKYLA